MYSVCVIIYANKDYYYYYYYYRGRHVFCGEELATFFYGEL